MEGREVGRGKGEDSGWWFGIWLCMGNRGGGKALDGLSGRRIALERRTNCMLVSRQQEPEVY